jgi:hypothetical protein
LADTFHEKLHLEKNGFRLVVPHSQLHGKKLALAILARQIVVFLAESCDYLHQCAKNPMQAQFLQKHKKPSTAEVHRGDLR